MSTLKVKAIAGVKVPYEDNARKYITDSDAVDVPANAYYLRRLADGDLVEFVPAQVQPADQNGAVAAEPISTSVPTKTKRA